MKELNRPGEGDDHGERKGGEFQGFGKTPNNEPLAGMGDGGGRNPLGFHMKGEDISPVGDGTEKKIGPAHELFRNSAKAIPAKDTGNSDSSGDIGGTDIPSLSASEIEAALFNDLATPVDPRPWRDPYKTPEENDGKEKYFQESISWALDVAPRQNLTADRMSTVEIEEETFFNTLPFMTVPEDTLIDLDNVDPGHEGYIPYGNNIAPDGDSVVLDDPDAFPLLMKAALESGARPLLPDDFERSMQQAVEHQQKHIDRADASFTTFFTGVRLIRDNASEELLVQPVMRYYGITSAEGYKDLACDETCADTPRVYKAVGPWPEEDK